MFSFRAVYSIVHSLVLSAKNNFLLETLERETRNHVRCILHRLQESDGCGV